ncbi:MAG: inositol monophosphatase family protein [Pseudomonadota bacterium]
MHPLINIAVRAARSAGTIITRSINHIDTLTITEKGANDFVSEVDHRAEQEIIKTIRKAYPEHAILAEESGRTGVSDTVWIIDPLDGTTNFLHGFPQYAVSIGIQVRGRLEHGVVFDPIKDELFTASRGDGAQLNGKRIRVGQRTTLQGALLGTGIPYRRDQDLELYLKTLRALLPGSAGVRRAGSAALDLAYVAANRLDGFWEFGLNAWDMAAGVVLVQEAGGFLTDFAGNHHYLESGNVVCGGAKIHSAMLQAIQQQL